LALFPSNLSYTQYSGAGRKIFYLVRDAAQQTIRTAGGVWNRAKRVWELRSDQVVGLDLTERVVALD
jgi:hypothetical protein